jgi:hypothetical protein
VSSHSNSVLALCAFRYLICFFIPLTAHQFSLPAAARGLTWVSIIYAGITPYIMYVYQFRGVRTRISAQFDKWGIRNMRDVGLLPQAEDEHDQVALFLYILPALAVFAVSVVRLRISRHDPDLRDDVDETGEDRSKWKRVGHAVMLYSARLVWLESDKVIVLGALASSLFGCTNVLGFPTVVFVFLALLKAGALRSVFFAVARGDDSCSTSVPTEFCRFDPGPGLGDRAAAV